MKPLAHPLLQPFLPNIVLRQSFNRKERYVAAEPVLTANQVEVVRWLATPQKRRQLKTEAELAADLGVRPATVSKWRKKLGLDAHASAIVR